MGVASRGATFLVGWPCLLIWVCLYLLLPPTNSFCCLEYPGQQEQARVTSARMMLQPYPITSACPPLWTPKPVSFPANSNPLRHNPTYSALHPSRTPFHRPS